jgi:hypothetical protein
MHQRLKKVQFCASVSPDMPTTTMSGSFQ